MESNYESITKMVFHECSGTTSFKQQNIKLRVTAPSCFKV